MFGVGIGGPWLGIYWPGCRHAAGGPITQGPFPMRISRSCGAGGGCRFGRKPCGGCCTKQPLERRKSSPSTWKISLRPIRLHQPHTTTPRPTPTPTDPPETVTFCPFTTVIPKRPTGTWKPLETVEDGCDGAGFVGGGGQAVELGGFYPAVPG